MTRLELGQLVDELTALFRENSRSVDEQSRFPIENLKALRDSGLMGLLIPVSHGGLGGRLDEFVQVAAELASGCLSSAMIWAMHCQQVDAVVRHGSAQLRAELLPRIATGQIYLASVTTEAGKGGHLLTAVDPLRGDDQLLIERDAPVVTGGAEADGFLITMRASETSASHEVSLVYADRAHLDIEITGDWSATGMRGTDSRGLALKGIVPKANIIGRPGGFRDVALDSMIPLAHIGWSACWLGGARGVMRGLVDEIRTRKWTPDMTSELFRERLARIRIDLELVAAYLDQMCSRVSAVRTSGGTLTGPADQIRLNVLKVSTAELTFRATDHMVQLAGLNRGYSRSATVPVERAFRDLRTASLNYSNDRLLAAIGALIPMDRSVSLAGISEPRRQPD